MLHSRHSYWMLVFVAGLSSCDLLSKLDSKKMATDIQGGIEKDGVKIKSLTCPDGQKDKDGEKFDCDGETADGTKFKVAVTATGNGGIRWDLVGRIVNPDELHKRIKDSTGSDFDCGADKRIAVKGVEIDCKLGTEVVAVKFTDDEGNIEVSGLAGKESENIVRKGLEAEGVKIKTIACPPTAQDKEGAEFDCDGEAADGTKFKVGIKATGGGVNWKLVGKIVDPGKIHENLKNKTGKDFDCGADKRIAVKGVEIDCKRGGDVVAVKFVDDDGNVEVSENDAGAPAQPPP